MSSSSCQRVEDPPVRLLAQIPNLEIIEMDEAEICCGSAGTYNIDQPETAKELGQRKIQNLLNTGAELAASGNIGVSHSTANAPRKTRAPPRHAYNRNP